MKTHFDKDEKELIRELCGKLTGEVLDIDDLIVGVSKLIGDDNFDIYINRTNDIRYDYILYYKEIEIGIQVEIINEYQYKIRDITWHEF